MENEEKAIIYNKGVNAWLKHTEPSDRTKEALKEIKAHCSMRGEEISTIKEDINNIEKSMPLVIQKLDTIDERTEKIEKQVNATNGRVNRLENWKAYTAGAISIILLLVLPTVIFVLKDYFNSKDINHLMDSRIVELETRFNDTFELAD